MFDHDYMPAESSWSRKAPFRQQFTAMHWKVLVVAAAANGVFLVGYQRGGDLVLSDRWRYFTLAYSS
jgi:hypothetical protein